MSIQFVRVLRHIAVCSLCLLLNGLLLIAESSDQKLKTDSIFAGESLLEISIQLPPQDWRILRTQYSNLSVRPDENGFKPSSYTYFKGDITIDGLKVQAVGIRKKGSMGSVISTRPSLKIKFNKHAKGQRFAGLRHITLNNNNQDPSRIHQYLVYKVFREAGVPAPRCNLARVTVNGEYLGIYSHVESIKTEFLERHFDDANGNLYEGQGVDFREGHARFERKTNEAIPGRSELDAVVKILATEKSDLLEELGEILELDAFMRFWAAEVLTGHWDRYALNMNNFFLYQSPVSGKLNLIPWGADSAFGDRSPFISYEPPASVYAESLLCRRLYQNPEGRKRYRSVMREVLDSAWDQDELLREVDRLEALIAEHIVLSPAASSAGREKVRNYIRAKGAAVRADLAGDAPDYPVQKQVKPEASEKGTLVGTFKTKWSDSVTPNPLDGEATFRMVIGDEEIEFAKMGANAGISFDPVRSEYPSIRLYGFKAKGGGTILCMLAVDPYRWEKGVSLNVDKFQVFGVLMETSEDAGPDDFHFKGMLQGTLKLDKSSRVSGEEVSGSVNLEWR